MRPQTRSPLRARRRPAPARALLVLAFVVGCSAGPWASTAVASPPDAAQIAADDHRPTVVVVSMDGVRHDYPDRATLPGVQRMEREGARAERLVPVFPASTFPNHVALATGAHADRHGIVDNRFWDRARGESFAYENDAAWLQAEPVWSTAERQGVRAAVFFWVGSETDWGGYGASFRIAPFDDGVTEEAKLSQIEQWLTLPAAERPRLIMTWWHGADGAGHGNGPDHPAVVEALIEQDGYLQRLQGLIDGLDAWDHTTLLLVSDHGMTMTSKQVDLGGALDAAGFAGRQVARGSHVELFFDDPSHEPTVAAIEEALGAVPGVSVYRRSAVPVALRFAHPSRTGDLSVFSEPPYYFLGSGWLPWLHGRARALFGIDPGQHGYRPDHPDMGAIFLAMGRGVPRGAKLGNVRAIDVAPTIAALLGIDPPLQAEGVVIEPLAAEAVD